MKKRKNEKINIIANTLYEELVLRLLKKAIDKYTLDELKNRLEITDF